MLCERRAALADEDELRFGLLMPGASDLVFARWARCRRRGIFYSKIHRFGCGLFAICEQLIGSITTLLQNHLGRRRSLEGLTRGDAKMRKLLTEVVLVLISLPVHA